MPARFTKEAQELIDYIVWLNAKVGGAFELTTDLNHWAGYGVHTKDELGDYIDACVARECESDDGADDYSMCDPIEPSWDAVSRHDMNEGW